jgi:hypothetical protein
MTPPTHSTPTNTRLRRSLRRFTVGSGPLKRRSDRLQFLGRLVVVLSFLLAPPLAIGTANRTATHLQAVAASEAAERSGTHAVVLADAPPRASTSGGEYSVTLTTVPVPAVWSAPGGATQQGVVMVAPGTRSGAVVPIWVDREGAPTRPPLDPVGIPDSAAAVGALPMIGLPLIVWLLYALLCSTLNAHRERRWAEDWAAVEPRWNSRLG